ncbi:MAG: hypothetical protein AB7O67_14730 [Vicinamibacterales bacterium]
MTSWILGGLTLVCLVQGVLLFRVLRMLGAMERAEDRLSQFSGALALLTETTESGFRALALELGRLGKTGAAAASSRSTNGRVSRAAKRGRSVPEIAAAEDVSEGEVRLRLSLAERGRTAKENGHASLRAR